MKNNIIVIGAGGHAKVLIDCLQQQENVNVIGILDTNSASHHQEILGVRILGDEDKLKEFSPHNVQLVNAIGSTDIPLKRKKIFLQLKEKGYHFFSVVHPSAYIGRLVNLGEGIQIMAGCIVQTNSTIGINTIINTGTIIEHDCHIKDHVHLAPGVKLAGNVYIDDSCHLGIGAVVIQGITIKNNSLIGAGSVVINNVEQGQRMAGIPAKNIKEDFLNGRLEKHIT